MRLLLSNDDGVHAPGIRALYAELKDHYQTTVIAPLNERSTTGHSLSLDTPLRIEKFDDHIYGCSGFPADCVLMGVGHLLKNNKPQLVISGINRGANLAQDMYYSGTIAAAREGAFHGLPAIAVSLVFDHMTDPHRYETAAKVIRMCVDYKLHEACPEFSLLNINVPNVEFSELKGVKLTSIGFRHYSEEIHAKTDARGRDYFWIAGHLKGFRQDEQSDCYAVAQRYVSVTPHALIDGINRDNSKLREILGKINAEFSS